MCVCGHKPNYGHRGLSSHGESWERVLPMHTRAILFDRKMLSMWQVMEVQGNLSKSERAQALHILATPGLKRTVKAHGNLTPGDGTNDFKMSHNHNDSLKKVKALVCRSILDAFVIQNVFAFLFKNYPFNIIKYIYIYIWYVITCSFDLINVYVCTFLVLYRLS